VVFLGDWCRRYERKNIWQNLDAVVAAPYALSKSERDFAAAEARKIESTIFPHLCKIMNATHDTDHDERFWRILLGHWFRMYVDVAYNRVKTLEACLRDYKISGTTTYDLESSTLIVNDLSSFFVALNDDIWENVLCGRILLLLSNGRFNLEQLGETSALQIVPNMKNDLVRKKEKTRTRILVNLKKLLNFGVRDSDALITYSYLPKLTEIRLQLALGQAPNFWDSTQPELTSKPNMILRANLAKELTMPTNNTVASIVAKLVFELIPVCYLEGFREMKDISELQNLPRNPKFVFTSARFQTDEVFKFWIAYKVVNGTRYFIGQHGNNYGTLRYFNLTNEELTSDRFLTWGWSEDSMKHVPAFVLKTAGRRERKYDKAGGLLLIENFIILRRTPWDNYPDYEDYFTEQLAFVTRLDVAVRNELTIRLHAQYRNLKWNELDRWNEFDSSLKVDTGQSPINDLLAKNRLIVHSYDSTGILETLSLNIPTLAFWQNEFDHLRESVKPYYQLLLDAGIIHFSVDSISTKVNEVWDNVEVWWSQPEIQQARVEFCNNFARNNNHPIRDLKSILLNNLVD
jgi:putative transferase (TIGR04331 family)